jgi:leader peptidase (prepilin peptidase)/N-methyltransferase
VVAIAGGVGLAVGSFLNVVVYRVPRHLSVARPPSFCPRCRTPVRPIDNIPVASWLVLGGRCRACGTPIPVRYPLVEAGTGLLFALVGAAVGAHWAFVGLCAAGATVLASAVVELDGLRPPPVIALVGTASSLALLTGAAAAERGWGRLAGAGGGAALALLVALAASRWAPATPGTRLRGAGWVLAPAGLVLGWVGPIAAAAGIGALGSLLLLLPASRRPSPEAQPGGLRAAGISSATALSCVTAVVVALGVGASLWR